MRFDPLAHLVEHCPFKAGVPRSSRGWVTKASQFGRVAELVYAHALGACGETLGGSNPLPPINERATYGV